MCIAETIDKFRRVFGAEALVDVIYTEPSRLVLHFHGNMCHTCGAYDYFEDFAHMYSECAGEDWGVETYSQNPDGTYTVTLRPKRLLKSVKRHIKIFIDGKEIDPYLEAS